MDCPTTPPPVKLSFPLFRGRKAGYRQRARGLQAALAGVTDRLQTASKRVPDRGRTGNRLRGLPMTVVCNPSALAVCEPYALPEKKGNFSFTGQCIVSGGSMLMARWLKVSKGVTGGGRWATAGRSSQRPKWRLRDRGRPWFQDRYCSATFLFCQVLCRAPNKSVRICLAEVLANPQSPGAPAVTISDRLQRRA